ncbi:hypothetical protein [Corynebacterium sp. sy039]|uniref:hypothetical protein n=1 Tax=Corynebacterium sp. sy039 TaxID=2599641 RepID=UPI0011B548E1|nr:hypothetical protein [Corynebacterium sp. sy039]QDZ42755.1 hypothetical protein FQV43_05990 [Corynebacterium sp. sy039]
MSNDLASFGMVFDNWQHAVEAAIATNQLSVTGEVRGGQLVQYTDASGAQINILAVEPFAAFAGFEALTISFAHVTMLNDVLALCEIIGYDEKPITQLTCNLSQGPLLVDEPEQRWQQIGLTALAHEIEIFSSETEFLASYPDALTHEFHSLGAAAIGDGSATPNAEATFSAKVLEAEYRTNSLTGQRFIRATVDGSFAFDLCFAGDQELPKKGAIIRGSATLVGSLIAPQGCGGACQAGGCGCGGH